MRDLSTDLYLLGCWYPAALLCFVAENDNRPGAEIRLAPGICRTLLVPPETTASESDCSEVRNRMGKRHGHMLTRAQLVLLSAQVVYTLQWRVCMPDGQADTPVTGHTWSTCVFDPAVK